MNNLRSYLSIVCCFAALLLPARGASAANSPASPGPWGTIVVAPETTSPVALAVTDLQRYLGQLSGNVPVLLDPEAWQSAPRPALILGTAESNPLIGQREDLLRDVGPQGYRIEQGEIGGAPVVFAAARTSEGLVNATYGLLHTLGFGFYLGSEGVPQKLPEKLTTRTQVWNPVFAVRGVLPWYNFFNSPTTWDMADHRAFVDQLVRMRANFVGFHVYDNEPFAAYKEKGRMRMGKRLADSSQPVWSTTPMPTQEFSSGSADVYAKRYFGAETTKEPDSDRAIRLEQQIMANALAYARARGLHACIGFEVHGDPTGPAERERFVKRFQSLLDTYPAVDHVWLWQPEMRGARGTVVPAERDAAGEWITTHPLGLYGIARRQTYARAANAKANPRYLTGGEEGALGRSVEGARMEIYAQLALRVLSQRSDPPRLILSGWGGEDRMISAEYYEGLDKVLPKSVIFASLDFMVPRARIDSIYSQLPADRERWPIPWLEWDGDQWHPQSYVGTYEEILRNAHASGSQGILGIHWRTREVEENLAYAVQYAWNPELTASDFYDGYARRLYGEEIATSMSAILSGLDRLGYRWVGGKGQAEYNHFAWGPGTDPHKVERLRELLGEARALLPRAESGRQRLEWLVHRMEYVLAFQELAEAAVKARDLLARAGAARDTTQTRELAGKALQELDSDLLHRAVQAYTLRLSTRGEYGVLATINTKAVPDWREMVRRASALAGEDYTTPTTVWKPEPRILLPRFHGSWPAGSALELHPIVLGERDAWIHYRTLGDKDWITESLPLYQRRVHYAQLPPQAMRPPGVEVAFSFSENPHDAPALGPFGITVMPEVQGLASAPGLEAGGEAALDGAAAQNIPSHKLRITRPENGLLRVGWTDIPEATHFRVLRNGSPVAETPLTFYLDRSSSAAHYAVEAWKGGENLAVLEK